MRNYGSILPSRMDDPIELTGEDYAEMASQWAQAEEQARRKYVLGGQDINDVDIFLMQRGLVPEQFEQILEEYAQGHRRPKRLPRGVQGPPALGPAPDMVKRQMVVSPPGASPITIARKSSLAAAQQILAQAGVDNLVAKEVAPILAIRIQEQAQTRSGAIESKKQAREKSPTVKRSLMMFPPTKSKEQSLLDEAKYSQALVEATMADRRAQAQEDLQKTRPGSPLPSHLAKLQDENLAELGVSETPTYPKPIPMGVAEREYDKLVKEIPEGTQPFKGAFSSEIEQKLGKASNKTSQEQGSSVQQSYEQFRRNMMSSAQRSIDKHEQIVKSGDWYFNKNTNTWNIDRKKPLFQAIMADLLKEATPQELQDYDPKTKSWRGGKIPDRLFKMIKDDPRYDEQWRSLLPSKEAYQAMESANEFDQILKKDWAPDAPLSEEKAKAVSDQLNKYLEMADAHPKAKSYVVRSVIEEVSRRDPELANSIISGNKKAAEIFGQDVQFLLNDDGTSWLKSPGALNFVNRSVEALEKGDFVTAHLARNAAFHKNNADTDPDPVKKATFQSLLQSSINQLESLETDKNERYMRGDLKKLGEAAEVTDIESDIDATRILGKERRNVPGDLLSARLSGQRDTQEIMEQVEARAKLPPGRRGVPLADPRPTSFEKNQLKWRKAQAKAQEKLQKSRPLGFSSGKDMGEYRRVPALEAVTRGLRPIETEKFSVERPREWIPPEEVEKSPYGLSKGGKLPSDVRTKQSARTGGIDVPGPTLMERLAAFKARKGDPTQSRPVFKEGQFTPVSSRPRNSDEQWLTQLAKRAEDAYFEGKDEGLRQFMRENGLKAPANKKGAKLLRYVQSQLLADIGDIRTGVKTSLQDVPRMMAQARQASLEARSPRTKMPTILELRQQMIAKKATPLPPRFLPKTIPVDRKAWGSNLAKVVQMASRAWAAKHQ